MDIFQTEEEKLDFGLPPTILTSDDDVFNSPLHSNVSNERMVFIQFPENEEDMPFPNGLFNHAAQRLVAEDVQSKVTHEEMTHEGVMPSTMKTYILGLQRGCQKDGLLPLIDKLFSYQQKKGMLSKGHNILTRLDLENLSIHHAIQEPYYLDYKQD